MSLVRRHLFTLFALLSLALCASTAALWAISYALNWQAAGEPVDADGFGRTAYSMEVVGGRMMLSYTRVRVAANQSKALMEYYRPKYAPEPWLRCAYYPSYGAVASPSRWSFTWRPERDPQYTGGRVQAAVPCWFPFLLTAAAPALLLWQRIRKRRQLGLGLCRSCGYDLRASPDRCPECGAMIASSAQ